MVQNQIPWCSKDAECNAGRLATIPEIFQEGQVLRFLEKQSVGLARAVISVCAGCYEPHHCSMFSPDQLEKPDAFERDCLARATPLKVCSHVQLFYHESDLIASYWGGEGIEYGRLCSQHDPTLSTISTFDLGRPSHPKPERSYRTGWRKKYHSETRYMLEYSLQCGVTGNGGLIPTENLMSPICKHLKLVNVLRLISPRYDRKKHAMRKCEECYTIITRRIPRHWESQVAEIWVQRCLGYGGNVPDEWWRAAVGLQ